MATIHQDLPAGHKPYIADDQQMREFSWTAVITGTLLGLVFGASSLYLVLKVGMTVSASIPVAVLSITIFRALGKVFLSFRTTILENNIVQTTGSAGESIAFGVGVTMPALMLIGVDMDLGRIMVVSLLGGILGILMMIPLRRAFIVNLHGKPGEPGKLVYPEGTACAQVLINGEKGGTSGAAVFIGFGIAIVHKILSKTMHVLMATVAAPLSFFSKAAVLTGDMASEMLGVGYIIGTRTASLMMAGAVLGTLVIGPLILFFGDGLPEALKPADKRIAEMSLDDIHGSYMRVIGAGCVSAAGIISMCKTLPLILRSILAGLGNLGGGAVVAARRTERDLPMKVVLLGSLALLAVLAVFLLPEVGAVQAILGAALVLLFGFLFVTVSSRLTGEIGSSSNPISGMTVATLLLTCLIFLGLGMTGKKEAVLALSVAGVVCIAASNGGTTSQDLKTGFLLGATPPLQQWAILIGAITSALVIGFTLLLFNQAGTIYSQKNLPDARPDAATLKGLPTETYDGTTYKVWWPMNDAAVKPGKYLVDDSGKVRYLVDPTITGKLTERDNGDKVGFKFPAKTQVMGIIVNGLLAGKLNWTLILIGAFIAVMLELCGVSSLAFAVGVYLPMANTMPIFLGGLARWGVDAWNARESHAAIAQAANAEARAQAEIDALTKSETNAGVLLASGFIAGGSMGGVLGAFSISDFLKKINYEKTLEGSIWQSTPVALAVFGILIWLLLMAGIGKFFAGDKSEID